MATLCDVKDCREPADPVPVPGGPNFDRATAEPHADLCPHHRRILERLVDAFLSRQPEITKAIEELDEDPDFDEVPF